MIVTISRIRKVDANGKEISEEDVYSMLEGIGYKDIRIVEDVNTREYVVHAKVPSSVQEIDTDPVVVNHSLNLGEVRG